MAVMTMALVMCNLWMFQAWMDAHRWLELSITAASSLAGLAALYRGVFCLQLAIALSDPKTEPGRAGENDKLFRQTMLKAMVWLFTGAALLTTPKFLKPMGSRMPSQQTSLVSAAEAS